MNNLHIPYVGPTAAHPPTMPYNNSLALQVLITWQPSLIAWQITVTVLPKQAFVIIYLEVIISIATCTGLSYTDCNIIGVIFYEIMKCHIRTKLSLCPIFT